MKVLFAVSNEKMSETIVKKYQKEYKQIISYKNVYYFNAILKELQRDKTYDRVVISEDLEQYGNLDYEQRDKFLFDKLDSISDEASNMKGEDIPIILICIERRTKAEPMLVKLFGIGIYNAIIGNDRSVNEVSRLINRPRSKKEAKIYYQIDAEDVSYEKEDENDVSELEIQNILAYYKRLGNDEELYAEIFDKKLAEQYSDIQLRIISKCLPLNVRAVLEERSAKYQQINSYNNKISDKVRVNKKQEKASGTSEVFLNNSKRSGINEPVVVPSTIDTSKKRKISTKIEQPTSETKELKGKSKKIESVKSEPVVEVDEIEIEDIPEIETIPEVVETIKEESKVEKETIKDEESVEQPVKRKRGRPRKVVEEPVEPAPKRKRGRPRKVVEPEETVQEDNREELIIKEPEEEKEEMILPGIEINEEEVTLPGIEDNNENEVLPGLEPEIEEEAILPGFGEEIEEETTLPGIENEEERTLPGFGNDNEEFFQEIESAKIDTEIPSFENNGIEGINNTYSEPVYGGLGERATYEQRRNQGQYPELNINEIMMPKQKLVAFVGTSKNGTSFLINNVAEILSNNGIDTAILDLTHNRNSYYIYTKNEDRLREKTNHILGDLKAGRADGIQEHKNLTIYTTAIEGDEELQDVEPIIETLVKKHGIVLMDCDFSTPTRYFKYAQEIYLVQSMDILTIQPLTAFIRQLSDKGMFEESKARVIINKYIRTKEINEELLIGGMSIYSDAAMTVRKELFNRRTVPHITIPFDLKTYLSYLDGLVECNVKMKGYSKDLMQSLRKLANMIYQMDDGKASKKYTPPSMKKNADFSK
ncbi:MAG: hypothetical protein HFJ55_07705 [Clostridia bacterium]|nr:hypothetical protein [Clostridia bacterium]